jgi:magnesium chelatase family protein
MFARVFSGGLLGLESYRLEVEVDCSGGIGQIHIVGLPDASVKEAQERVKAAIKACNFLVPPGKKWTVNMAPADTRKEGPLYDLPIAIGILAATELVPVSYLNDFWFIGELGLDGSIRPVSGVLPIAMAAKNSGAYGIVVPDANAEEAALVDGLAVYPVSHLQQVCGLLRDPRNVGRLQIKSSEIFRERLADRGECDDFAEVKGQKQAKRGLEIAAAGRHNILMVGPPGAGKSMLAQRMPGIMPPLTFDEALELTKLYSVAGLLRDKTTVLLKRPFRAPHHSASAIGLIGGGTVPKPGEISLSHMGILFLDELTEFPRSHLDTLRQPLESSSVTITRATQTLTYPASFVLIGACNPCPCGYRGDTIKYCTCTPAQADRYWSRLSGPILDRIDLQVNVVRLKDDELALTRSGDSSETIRLRVERAVARQRSRWSAKSFAFNAHLTPRQLLKICPLNEEARLMLAQAVTQMGMSARAYDRILRVARTIADLEDRDELIRADIAEALRYRTMSRIA